MGRRSWVCLGALAALLASARAHAVDLFTADTFLPYTVNDVNAILANRTFIQSMLAFDAAPFTVGLSTYQARVDWARADGSIYRGSLDRTKMLLSVGGGRPTTGFAGYAVLNVDGINSGPWPSLLQNAIADGHILAESYGIVAGGGVAYHGVVAQVAYFFHKTAVDSDELGRLGYCDTQDIFACSQPLLRSGGPVAAPPVSNTTTTVGNTMLTLQSSKGYSTSALIGPSAVAGEDQTTLASLRFLAQPTRTTPRRRQPFELCSRSGAKP